MRRVQGASLLETMVVMAIVAVLAAIGIPGMVGLVRDVRQDTSVLEMISSLSFARSEAVMRGRRVTLCPSTDGVACLGRSFWDSGWIVFTDIDGDGQVDAGEAILRSHGPLHPSSTLRGGRLRITYQSTGFSTGYNDTLELCDARGNAGARSLVLSQQGRVRVTRGAHGCP